MRSQFRARFGRCCTALGLLALLGACAMTERARAVYLQQHQATTALTETIVIAEADDPDLAERLYATEADLDDACAPLREASYRKLAGDPVDSELEWAIFDALDACAAKTAEVERLIWRVDPETARYFLRTTPEPGRGVASLGDQN